MAIACADIFFRKLFRDSCRGHVWQIEAKRWHSLVHVLFLRHPVDYGAAIAEHPEHFKRKRFFVGPDCLERMPQSGPRRSRFCRRIITRQASAQRFQVSYGSIHPGHIFVNKGACLDFAGGFVRNEILTEGRELFKKFAASPEKTHVGTKDLVARANQVIAVEGLHIDQPMRAVVHGIEKNFCRRRMGHSCCRRDIDNRAKRIRSQRACHQSRRRRDQRD